MYIHACIHTYRERKGERKGERKKGRERERKREGESKLVFFELNKEELEGRGSRINSPTMDKHPELHLHLDLQLYLSPVLFYDFIEQQEKMMDKERRSGG